MRSSRITIGILLLAVSFSGACRTASPPLDAEADITKATAGYARVTLTFRRLGASRWSENQRIEHALRAAATARAVLADDSRRVVCERATRAIVVVYEDATLARGCAVVARWECVVPAPAQRDVKR